MKPMLAIVEYASIRLMLVCAIAMTLPRIIDSSDEHHQHALPVELEAAERDAEQPQHERERGELGRRADQQRHRRRRAVVNVGHPHVVRHRAELERDARDHEHEPEEQDRPVALPAASTASRPRTMSSEPVAP